MNPRNFFTGLKGRLEIHDRVLLPTMHVFALLLSLTLPLSVPAQSPVPIEREPRHRLKFENQFVRVFDVLIPPGDMSLFHIHVHDGLSVPLTDAHLQDETLAGASEEITLKRGAVKFAYRPTSLIHRVSNIGRSPFRNIFVEILPSTDVAANVPSPAAAADYEVVLENERVRILRLRLAPGKTIESRAQARRAVRIAVSGGEIVTEAPDKKRSAAKIEPGDIEWQEEGSRYICRNIGSAPFEAVEIELK
jgi:hypothetical protein